MAATECLEFAGGSSRPVQPSLPSPRETRLKEIDHQKMKTNYDAIIVGGGPAGSTAAILLAQAGWSVAVIEKHAFPRRKVCGECIAATNLALFDLLGIGLQLDALAGRGLRSVGLCVSEEMLIGVLLPF